MALVLSLCACSEGGESDKKATGKLPALGDYDLYAGYSRKNVTPLEPVGLGGYSNPADRTHKAVIDKIYVTAIALTDAKGKTILLMNWDGVRSYTALQDAVRTAIAQELGIEKNDIFFGATHTHSAPDLNYTSEAISRYISFAMEQFLACAREAYHDRRPARMSVGSIETESLNFVRHYMTTNEDGTISYFGDNFGSAVYNETTAHTSQADPTMFMLHFEMAEGKDMCLINWRAHPHFTGSSGKYDLSSDYVGAFRDAFEYTTGVDMLYFNGAGGNINEKSRITEENRTKDYKTHGKILSDYATELMNHNLEQVEVDEIKTTSTVLTLNTHSQNHLLNDAGIFKAVYSATKSTTEAREATGGRVRSSCNDYNNSVNLYGGTLTITGTAKSGGVVYLGNNYNKPYHATLNVYGGAITGGSTKNNGGNVYVQNHSVVNLYGGEISNGNAGASGGNILLHNGTVNLLGGSLVGGSAGTSGADLEVRENGSVTVGGNVQVGGVYLPTGKTLAVSADVSLEGASIGVKLAEAAVVATNVTSQAVADCFSSVDGWNSLYDEEAKTLSFQQ